MTATPEILRLIEEWEAAKAADIYSIRTYVAKVDLGQALLGFYKKIGGMIAINGFVYAAEESMCQYNVRKWKFLGNTVSEEITWVD